MSRSDTPYASLPDHCFWSRSHRDRDLMDIDPVVAGHFRVTQETRIATAGSCFAQHVARYLVDEEFNYFVTETAHPVISPDVARSFNYGTFSARYGNIYTARQLLQLAQRARGLFKPAEDVWDAGERFIDPYRPAIQPGGFSRRDDYIADRERHYAAVRRMMDETELFVFTFGLTEAWRSKVDGAVFPLCPGVSGGRFDARKHEFVNFTVQQVVDDFRAFVALLRQNNPDCKVLMTVSPVPLAATARADRSVISATAYSKAVLRVACEELERVVKDCVYFPSYEIITGQHARGAYYGDDLREVDEAGVLHVMSLFMRHYTDLPEDRIKALALTAPLRDRPVAAGRRAEIERAMRLICDEELIEGKPNT